MTATVLPWQTANRDHVLGLYQRRQLPHALLLHGLVGTGIRQFAQAIARTVLCKGEVGIAPCGECHSCQLGAAGNHPDLLHLTPEREGGPIKVDQVRAVVGFGQESPQQGGYRVVMITPAEAMNASAANSLLKTLEEPGDKTLLLLVTYAVATVLPTVRSRCQKLAMAVPSPAQGKEWLGRHISEPEKLPLLHAFAPRQPLYGQQLEPFVNDLEAVADSLSALIEGSSDALVTAGVWSSVEPGQLLHWLYQWLSSACIAELQPGDADPVAIRIRDAWQKRGSLLQLVDAAEEVVSLRRLLASGANPNPQLMLENLALKLAPTGVLA